MPEEIGAAAKKASSDGLDGRWSEIIRVGSYDGETYTPEDLDAMVAEYRHRDAGAKALVGLGMPSQSDSEPVGKIEALRRVGDSVQARFASIDPNVEHLYRRGVFPKKSVQVKRSPKGISLQRVGLVVPTFRHCWRDDSTPSLAKLMEQNFGTKDHVFGEYGEAPRPWIEIFCAGDYTKAGKGSITPDDLRRVVRNYDPTYHEAPETLGHKADDQPAYGWIDALMLDGDKLLARERQVDPKFDEARRQGKFKKRSASFYHDDAGNITGLRNLAWLGAGIPEVKGLRDVVFDDRGQKFLSVDFIASDLGANAVIGRMKDRGYWMQAFDHFNFPAVFAELEGTSALGELAQFLEKLMNECDLTSALLSERARYLAQTENLTFGEALGQISQRSLTA